MATIAGARVTAGRLVASQGSIVADAQAVSSSAIWNAGGVTFTHWKANVTDTASAAGSLLFDLQVGGVSKISCTKAGALTVGASLGVDTGGYQTTLTQDGTGTKLRHNSAIRNFILGVNGGTAITINLDNSVGIATVPPASAAATGVAGTVTWDASFIYVCVATDTWKRAAIATW